ncbi:MAG: hypothetical protein HYS04_15610 [Acidobacteria bacterium]|nr:hypothetical protein [Acidobacteriota bacterium]
MLENREEGSFQRSAISALNERGQHRFNSSWPRTAGRRASTLTMFSLRSLTRQDRPTIERELSALLDDDQKPQPSEVDFPHDTPLANGEWVFSGTGPKRAH